MSQAGHKGAQHHNHQFQTLRHSQNRQPRIQAAQDFIVEQRRRQHEQGTSEDDEIHVIYPRGKR